MPLLMAQLWNDDAGALLSMEFLFLATILVIGIVVGLTNVREAINVELTELANAILALAQSPDDEPGLITPPVLTPPFMPSNINVEACNQG